MEKQEFINQVSMLPSEFREKYMMDTCPSTGKLRVGIPAAIFVRPEKVSSISIDATEIEFMLTCGYITFYRFSTRFVVGI